MGEMGEDDPFASFTYSASTTDPPPPPRKPRFPGFARMTDVGPAVEPEAEIPPTPLPALKLWEEPEDTDVEEEQKKDDGVLDWLLGSMAIRIALGITKPQGYVDDGKFKPLPTRPQPPPQEVRWDDIPDA